MKQTKLKQSMISSAVIIAFSLWMILYAIPTQIPVNALQKAAAGSLTGRSFPYFAAILICAASTVLFLSSAVKYIKQRRHESEEKKKTAVEWRKELRALGVLLLCFIYGVLFMRFGFILATVIVPPLMLFVLGSRNWKHYLSTYIACAVIFSLFYFVMGVNLL